MKTLHAAAQDARINLIFWGTPLGDRHMTDLQHRVVEAKSVAKKRNSLIIRNHA